MNKNNKVTLSIIFLLTGAIIACRLLHIIDFYTVFTPSMEPNYDTSSFLMATSLVQPGYNSVVAYRSQVLPIEGVRATEKGVFIGRITGMGGDILEIRDGRTYINGRIIDKDIPLKFLYQISPEIRAANKKQIEEITKGKYIPRNQHTIYLSDDELQQISGKENLIRLDSKISHYADDFPVQPSERKVWTLMNYGPIKISENHVFIMGDNRHNSEDSRMKGFTHEDDIISTVIN